MHFLEKEKWYVLLAFSGLVQISGKKSNVAPKLLIMFYQVLLETLQDYFKVC